ncbi:kinase-like domain-containing protein [Glomus cerebriforme]|uniref:Kinase-like domain-containing protein n=1 Tax=Glomus cerebriforme TaxID=658196 RepID=A0A397TJK9_9GLOM|nr:kinase-like domain-containing protein [Glomus cerebriforme]
MDINLREYLQQNHIQLTWKKRIQFAYDIIRALSFIHIENAIHRDLHSGNILFSQLNARFGISDLGFCGPADKTSNSIYGNLPYIAPEVIAGKQTTFASDIYSIAMLMWEISSGQPPFINYEHDYDLAMNIINGIRPRIISGTPLEYESLMKQCWDADPLKRPDIGTLWRKMGEMNRLYQNLPNESEANNGLEINKTSNSNYTDRSFTSKVHQFENFPEPRNATEEEQEAFYSKSYDEFSIPDNIDDFNKPSNQKNDNASKKRSKIVEVKSERLTKKFKKLQIKNDSQSDYNNKQYHVYIDDDKEDVHNNSNLHSEEQNDLEIPEDI